ncbi:MAG: hypothetical protein V2I33_14735 [Kangiellaceae bacterium]|jgi:hypothetical protein|nr:hypothetical protein [Kangiellaceae bacterium]
MKIFISFLFVGLVFISNNTQACLTIEGIWRHASKPALVEFNLRERTARVKQHSANKHSEGLTIIRNIRHPHKSQLVWLGEMYHGEMSRWLPVTIKHRGGSIIVYDSNDKEVLKLLRQ